MKKSRRNKYTNGIEIELFYKGEQPEGWYLYHSPKAIASQESRKNKNISPEEKELKRQKYRESIIKKYGTWENYVISKTNKQKQTAIKKYGSLEEFYKLQRTNAEKTMMEKYGIPHNFCAGSSSIEKRKQTWMEKYGCEHPNQSIEVQEKRKNTCLEKYGVECITQSEEFNEKVQETIIQKYGSEEAYYRMINEKGIKTQFEKYGQHFFQTDEFKEKSNSTLIEKYGSLENAYHEINLKIQNTCLQKYGVDNYFKSEEFLNSMTPEKRQEIIQHSIETKRKKNTFNTSKSEAELYKLLISKYGEDDVFTNYQDIRYARESGYQFKCDFYIKSEDLFIELNLHPTHGGYLFDPENEEDLTKLFILENSDSQWDRNIAYVWGYLDVEKAMIARKNNLNHRMVYNFNEFCKELYCK